tara:strand:- start:102 stop:410 length:309 start_codon:yes stop_codon:yes gene_type:complete
MIKEMCKEFNITEDKYYEYNSNMRTPRFLVNKISDEDEDYCSILYFDSDGGVAFLSNSTDMFSEGAFQLKLIDCNYCDIPFSKMKEMISVIEKFEIECMETV